MREPGFWYRPPSLLSETLAPLGWVYGAVAARRMRKPGVGARVPVICVGNYQLGGAGKTPTVLALAGLLRAEGENPVVLSRGYGGRLDGPVQVDVARHAASDVGDEPVMMAARVPVVVARERVGGAALAEKLGASVIVMDDGFQNPSLQKTLSLIVVDAGRGLGNGRLFPAGPLRAPLAVQIARTEALLIVGEGTAAERLAAHVKAHGAPVFRASLQPEPSSMSWVRGQRLLAFAGIGDPNKFFDALEAAGGEVVKRHPFADHHPYSRQEIASLGAAAHYEGLTLVTTRKDFVRLGESTPDIKVFEVTLQFADRDAVSGWLRAGLTQTLRARAAG